MPTLTGVEGISVDFYDTLVFRPRGQSRGRALVAYLESHGFAHVPWEHQVLYDVFEEHDARYSPDGSPADRHAYYEFLADRVFRRLDVDASEADVASHAANLWEILGPGCLEVFPDAYPTLAALRTSGYPIVMVSNWPRGLRHFCAELGLSGYLDDIVGSADLGVAKPEPAIFEEACARLGLQPEHVLHVGDSLDEDYRGAEAAGLQAVLLQRDPESQPAVAHVIHGLDELPTLLRPRHRA